MWLVSPVVSTDEMCDLEVQHAKMAVVLRHLPRYLESSPTDCDA